MSFSSYDNILNYPYRYRSEVQQALASLESMYSSGNISEYQYKNAKKLLEDKQGTLP